MSRPASLRGVICAVDEERQITERMKYNRDDFPSAAPGDKSPSCPCRAWKISPDYYQPIGPDYWIYSTSSSDAKGIIASVPKRLFTLRDNKRMIWIKQMIYIYSRVWKMRPFIWLIINKSFFIARQRDNEKQFI